MKYQAVIFDLFGTLIDNYGVVEYSSALRETSSILKIQHTDFQRLWDETREKRTTGGFKTLEENLEYICRELNVPAKKFDINLAKMVRWDYMSLALAPRQYAIETLSQLKADGYKVGLISNCSMEVPVIWPVTSFAPFFEVTLFSSVTGMAKPDPRIFQLAAEKLGVATKDCLYVDDDPTNLNAAAGAGMGAVLIKNAEETEHPYEPKPKIDWPGTVVALLPEVLDILVE